MPGNAIWNNAIWNNAIWNTIVLVIVAVIPHACPEKKLYRAGASLFWLD